MTESIKLRFGGIWFQSKLCTLSGDQVKILRDTQGSLEGTTPIRHNFGLR